MARKQKLATLRTKLGLNQREFWGRLGLTQSGGSRYENSRRALPKPIQLLLVIAYGTAAQYGRVTKQLRA